MNLPIRYKDLKEVTVTAELLVLGLLVVRTTHVKDMTFCHRRKYLDLVFPKSLEKQFAEGVCFAFRNGKMNFYLGMTLISFLRQ